MKFTTYTDLALRTAKRQEPCHDLAHAVLGLVSESEELKDEIQAVEEINVAKTVDELGDHLWYLNLAMDTCSKMYPDYNHAQVLAMALGMASDIAIRMTNDFPNQPAWRFVLVRVMDESIAAMADMVKKFVITGKAPDEVKFVTQLASILACLTLIGNQIGADVSMMAEANIAKLSKRYPDLAFDAEAAIKRDKDAEMAAVEAKLNGGLQ